MYENEEMFLSLVDKKNKMDEAEAKRKAIAEEAARRMREIAEERARRRARKILASWFWLVMGWATCALAIYATASGFIPGQYGYPISCGFAFCGGALYGQFQEGAKHI